MSQSQLALAPKELVQQSTDIAGLCKEIVVASAVRIQGKKYVRVEGWQAIAIAHGCVASAKDVKKVEGGIIATGEIRRMGDGQLIATAEGFVGDDEKTWASRAEYARRAMAQTRAISRACRSAFAHVVVLMDAGLSTTPAEEVPEGGFTDEPHQSQQRQPEHPQQPDPIPQETWRAQLCEVEEKTFGTADNPSLAYVVNCTSVKGTKQCGTREKSIADEVKRIIGNGATCDLTVEQRKAGTWTLISVAAGSDDIPM